MKPAAEWDWFPVVATVIAVAMAVLITIAGAYAIGASVQLCPRELAVWSERIYEARRFKATVNVADAQLLPEGIRSSYRRCHEQDRNYLA